MCVDRLVMIPSCTQAQQGNSEGITTGKETEEVIPGDQTGSVSRLLHAGPAAQQGNSERNKEGRKQRRLLQAAAAFSDWLCIHAVLPVEEVQKVGLLPGQPALHHEQCVGSWQCMSDCCQAPQLAARLLQAASPLTVQHIAVTLSSFGVGATSGGEAELEQWPETLQQIMKAQGLTHAMPVQARSVQCGSPADSLGTEGKHGISLVEGEKLWSSGPT